MIFLMVHFINFSTQRGSTSKGNNFLHFERILIRCSIKIVHMKQNFQ